MSVGPEYIAGLFFFSVPPILPPVFLPFPMFLLQPRHHQLTADAVNSTRVQLVSNRQVLFLFLDEE